MKQLIKISFAFIILSFAACKKNSTDVIAPGTTVPKLKTLTVMNGATVANTLTYEYDNAGRLIKITYLDGSKSTYTYTGSTMLLEGFNANGATQNKYTYNLNAYGAAVSYYGNATPAVVTNLTYNAANQALTEITNTNGIINREQYYGYDNAGNRITDSLVQTTGTTIRTYEYYTDKISTLSNINFGDYYDGAGNPNSLKKETAKSSGNVITTVNFSIPEMDAQGRVIKQSYTTGGTTIDYLITYY